MASLLSLETVQDFYIAYYQRPADPSGQLYWADRLDAAGGDTTTISEAFGTSPESLALYGPINATTIGDVIDSIYLGLFDRLPDPAGKAFYTDGFLNGTFTAASLAYDILLGAQNDDAVAVTNKEIVANRFSETVDGHALADPLYGQGPLFAATYGGPILPFNNDLAEARGFLGAVTFNPTTISSQKDVTLFIQQNIANPGAPNNPDPILAGGILKTLTPGTDFIDLTASGLFDTIIGVSDPVPGAGTLTNGDTILGGGNTVLQLFANGNSGIAVVKDLSMIDVWAVASSTIEGVGFSNIDQINMSNGANGNAEFFNNIDRDTTLFISNITGTLSASFDVPGLGVYGAITNNDGGGPGGSLLIDTSNNVNVTLADSMSASVDFFSGPANVGDVNVTGGNNDSVFVSVDADGASGDDAVVGDVNVAMGDSSTFSFDGFASDNFTVGDITVGLGNSGTVSFYVTASGTRNIGDVNMSAGNSSYISLDVKTNVSSTTSTGSGDVKIGDINMSVGDAVSTSDSCVVLAYITNSNGNVSIGDVNLTVGDALAPSDTEIQAILTVSATGDVSVGDVNVLIGDAFSVSGTAEIGVYLFASGDVSVGDITAEAGVSTTVIVGISGSGTGTDSSDITVGNVDLTGGDSSYVSLSVDNGTNSQDIVVGDVSVTVGDSSTVDVGVFNTSYSGDIGNTTVGDITIVAGTSASIDVSISASVTGSFSVSGSVGDLTVGDVSVIALTSASVSMTFNMNAGSSGGDIGDLTVGSVTVDVGDFSHIYLYFFHSATSGTGGNVSVGDINVTMGNGTTLDTATLDLDVSSSAQSGLGDLAVGDITLSGGDFVDLSMEIKHEVSSGDVGTVTVGDISADAGISSSVTITVENEVSSSGNVGDMTVGAIDVTVLRDSTVNIYMEQFVYTGDAGALTVGDITVVAGHDTSVSVDIFSEASGGAGTGGNAGAMTVGNIDVSISGSNTVDADGTSTIDVFINHHAIGSHTSLGALDVGDISLSVGDNSSILLSVSQTGTEDLVGDLTIGAVSITVGDPSTAHADFIFQNWDDNGDLGNFSLGGLDVTIGDSSTFTGNINVLKFSDGDLGNVTIGAMTFDLGSSATATFDGYFQVDDGDAGNLSFGDLNATIGDSSSLSIDFNALVFGRVGDVSFGNVDATLGVGAEVQYLPFLFAEKDVGQVSVGDFTVVAGVDASLYASFEVIGSRDISGMSVGDLSINGAGGSTISATWEIDAVGIGGNAGAMTVGDLAITGTDKIVTAAIVAASGGGLVAGDIGKHWDGTNVDLSYDLFGTGGGDITLGNISVNLATLSDVLIDINQSTGGNVILGNLTVSGASGTVAYGGTFVSETGTFLIDVSGAGGPGNTTIGNVDYSGYTANAVIDVSLIASTGAASILGSSKDDTITGNNSANVIRGGKGVDIAAGGVGNDTFVFLKGDAPAGTLGTLATTDNVTDWTNALGNNDSLAFGLAAGSGTNYVEFGAFGTYALFLAQAAITLDSTVKYFAGTIGGDLYVAANQGSGEADSVVILVGRGLGDIDSSDIVAGP